MITIGSSSVSPTMDIGMSSAENAKQVEAVNPVIHSVHGNLINLETHAEFTPDQMITLHRIYRFGARVDFTVADHIFLGLNLCSSTEQKRFWVLHEAFEALTGIDCPRPLKASWPWYIRREDEYLQKVYEIHGLDFTNYPEMVGELDQRCLYLELGHFFQQKSSGLIMLTLDEKRPSLPDVVKMLFPEKYGETP